MATLWYEKTTGYVRGGSLADVDPSANPLLGALSCAPEDIAKLTNPALGIPIVIDGALAFVMPNDPARPAFPSLVPTGTLPPFSPTKP